MFSSQSSHQRQEGSNAADEAPLYEDGNHALVVIITFALFVGFILIYLAAGLVWASSVTAISVVLSFCYLKTNRCASLRRWRRAHVGQHAHQGSGGPSDAAIPAFAYKREGDGRGGDAAGWAQCIMCLGIVKVGEMVRQLPACNHLFHVECMDMWLHSHSSCPICRSMVLPFAGQSTPEV